MSDRMLGVVGLLLAAFYVWRATIIELSFISDPVGPKAFPFMIAIIVAISSAVFIWKPDPSPEWPAFGRMFEILMAAAVMVAYAMALSEAGFVASTAIAAAYLAWRLGAGPVQAIVAGIAISVGIYIVFHLILGLSLARGPWGF